MFFVAGYFHENQHEIIKDPQVTTICQLARSKGKVTKYFYLEGLKILANFILSLRRSDSRFHKTTKFDTTTSKSNT